MLYRCEISKLGIGPLAEAAHQNSSGCLHAVIPEKNMRKSWFRTEGRTTDRAKAVKSISSKRMYNKWMRPLELAAHGTKLKRLSLYQFCSFQPDDDGDILTRVKYSRTEHKVNQS